MTLAGYRLAGAGAPLGAIAAGEDVTDAHQATILHHTHQSIEQSVALGWAESGDPTPNPPWVTGVVPNLGGGRDNQVVARVGGISAHVVPKLSEDRATVTEITVLLTF